MCTYIYIHVTYILSTVFALTSSATWFWQLEAMGFDRAIVLEVYFACNKNEELAANYLLDHIHEFDD